MALLDVGGRRYAPPTGHSVRPTHYTVAVRIDRLEITNFRSFGPEKTTIRFPANESLLTIIGANNAGKSNLIEALRLVLGQIRRPDLTEADFHGLNLERELLIDLILREPVRREAIVRSKVEEIQGFRFRAHQLERGQSIGELKIDHLCLTPDLEVFRPIPFVGKSADEEGVTKRPALPELARRVLPELGRVHYLSPDLRDAFRTTGAGVLAQLLDVYRNDFRSPANKYKPAEGGEWTSIDAFERTRERLSEILRTELLAEIEAKLTENLSELLGPARRAEVSFTFPTLEELWRSISKLRLQDEAESLVVPVEHFGSGYQSLLRLAILETFAELEQAESPSIFLVEEPEAYLHPHFRRFFRTLLASLAERGHDVICTTHDPALVSLTDHKTVMRMTKRGGLTTSRRCEAELGFSYEKVARKLRGKGNEEMLFAERVVLCEGQDDVAVVRALLADVDLDVRSVSVVDCAGVGSLPDYVKLVETLGIEYMTVSDRDSSTGADDESIRKRVERLEGQVGERGFFFIDDVEQALGTEKVRDNSVHLVEVIEALSFDELPDDHEVAVLRARLREFTGVVS